MPSRRSKPASLKAASAPSASDPAPAEALTAGDLASQLVPFAVPADKLLLVAVSGGADSMALLRLAHAAFGTRIAAATVDHGLRPEAAAEAAQVAHWCAGLGVPHAILSWMGERPTANLHDAARAARYQLLADQAHTLGAVVLTAHHRDDQAETVWMRLQRGSGTAGLSGIRPEAVIAGARVLRPLLDVPKARLVATCRALGQPWIDDPSNADPRFDRARARAALAGAGLAADTLADLADRMARADEAIAGLTRDLLEAIQPVPGGVALPLGPLRFSLNRYGPVPLERALAQLLAEVGGSARPARSADLARLVAAVMADQPMRPRTLAWCRLSCHGDELLIMRQR
jgi:tRNA(Ile)-lysidine synthase